MLRSTRPPKCKVCKARLEKQRPGQIVHEGCVEQWLEIQRVKRRIGREKAEREQIKARKEKLKTRREWIAEAQAAVNRYCRLRDLHAHRGCISCGAKPAQAFGGTMDAGHFRSVGSAPHVRFLTTQIRLQCVRCNRHLSGNAVEFRRGLVELIGLQRVEQIEAMQGTAKWSIDYLRRLKSVMGKKARRLEKRQ